MRLFQETHYHFTPDFTPDFPRLEAPEDAGGPLERDADIEIKISAPARLRSPWQRQTTMASGMYISVASCCERFSDRFCGERIIVRAMPLLH
jgi:hypothetical protein